VQLAVITVVGFGNGFSIFVKAEKRLDTRKRPCLSNSRRISRYEGHLHVVTRRLVVTTREYEPEEKVWWSAPFAVSGAKACRPPG
jgi:hypothetical protein